MSTNRFLLRPLFSSRWFQWFSLLSLIAAGGCVHSVQRTLVDTKNLNTLRTDSPYLKVHMRNGDVCLLRGWSIPSGEKSIAGTGERLDLNRERIAAGEFIIPMDSVVLCETNLVGTAGGAVVMSVVTGASAIMTIYCITNPKACFGSCPTFYTYDGGKEILRAEGFSSSVAPSLERQDIDALYRVSSEKRTFSITMNNEALETHVVRHVRLLAAERPPHGRVLRDEQGLFHQVTRLAEPSRALGPEGDFTGLVRTYDDTERVSLTDSSDLGAKEELEMEFPSSGGGRVGIAIASRASLVSTFLFYQSLAFMGSKAGDWIARLERGDKILRKLFDDRHGPLGGIEVFFRNSDGNWEFAGTAGEHGPLASDISVVPLPAIDGEAVRVKLRLSKGGWRLDYVALASMGELVVPRVLPPAQVFRLGNPDENARLALLDDGKVISTLPGESMVLEFEMPENPGGYELFLDTKGYYLEWMRDEWLGEENEVSALRMFVDPSGMLRELAPEFKKREAMMESQFWRSRYARR